MESVHLQTAFERLASAHVFSSEKVLSEKRSLIRDVWGLKVLPHDLLRRHPALYIGSGQDIHLPLCLGWRKILLLDNKFENPAYVKPICQELEAVIGKSVVQHAWNRFSFEIDFGEGLERAQLTCVYAKWPEPALTARLAMLRAGPNLPILLHNARVDKTKYGHVPVYRHNNGPLSMLMVYSSGSARVEDGREAVDALAPGGLIYSTELSDMCEGTRFIRSGMAQRDFQRAMAKQIEKEGRFSPISLGNQPKAYVFLRKK